MLNTLHSTSQLATLGPAFYSSTPTTPLDTPALLDLNPQGVDLLGLSMDSLSPAEWTQLHNGELELPSHSPLCAVYSGHQFGVWAGQLGDGRAHTLGNINGWELQLKGAGLTPYSRMGDGRAVLRSTIREYLASEYMHAIGIPTTRSLGMITSHDPVYRETQETAAIMIRLSPSFLRFGTIEHFASLGQTQHIDTLLDHVQTQTYPDCQTPKALFTAITERTASLMAQWMAYGFCHGVMNTDNMSLSGLTLDYGPYGFLDHYDPSHICNHSDTYGRYSFQNQPRVAQWNLMALAVALQHTLDINDAEEIVQDHFSHHFHTQYTQLMTQRFGVPHTDANMTWIRDVLAQCTGKQDVNRLLHQLTHHPHTLEKTWPDILKEHTSRSNSSSLVPMATRNPNMVLYNWICQEVIQQVQEGSHDALPHLRQIMQTPFDKHSDTQRFTEDPPEWSRGLCISCSS